MVQDYCFFFPWEIKREFVAKHLPREPGAWNPIHRSTWSRSIDLLIQVKSLVRSFYVVKRTKSEHIFKMHFIFPLQETKADKEIRWQGRGKAVYKEMQTLAYWKKYVQFKIISIQNMPHTIKMIIIFIHIP